jgi:eukaryotic-like serine/threonine-protein kinase
MAKKLRVGDLLRGYRVTKVFGPGMMAISYAAIDSRGQKVFLKQYKSPAPTVVWYSRFVQYQHELSERVRRTRAGHFAVRQVDAFEEEWGGRCYFQAYEFVENGADLEKILEAEREQHQKTGVAAVSDATVWARHVTWAKVLLAGVAALHEARVVHSDLKPANAYLIADPTIGAGYQLTLIDMDFSLLADQRAPWHGFQGYIGSDNYRSPEHLVRGSIPTPASDVFTCGLMLYELLAGYHPYWHEDQTEYARQVQSFAAKPPRLMGSLSGSADPTEVAAAIHRSLSPTVSDRPSAQELGGALRGHSAGAREPPSARSPAGVTGGPTRPAIVSLRIELTGATGKSIELGVRTELGKALVRALGPDSEYWDARQCLLERDAQNRWSVIPFSAAANETMVNGEPITGPRQLRSGDQIAVGRQAKGIVKSPITVRGI